jgi:sarcosine oxidase delta subunit
MVDAHETNADAIECPWCGEWTRLEFTRGKYICPRCRRPVRDCCDGERNISGEQ